MNAECGMWNVELKAGPDSALPFQRENLIGVRRPGKEVFIRSHVQ
jgi:hypothetical protein